MSERYAELASEDSTIYESQLRPLEETWKAILNEIDTHLEKRRRFLENCRKYHHKHTEVDSDLDELVQELEKIQSTRQRPLGERVEELKVGPFHIGQ